MLDACWEVGGVQKPFVEMPSLSPKRSRFDFAREVQSNPPETSTTPSLQPNASVDQLPKLSASNAVDPANNSKPSPVSSFPANSTPIAAFPGPSLLPPLITLIPQLQSQPQPQGLNRSLSGGIGTQPSQPLLASQPFAAKMHSMTQLFQSQQSQPSFALSDFMANSYNNNDSDDSGEKSANQNINMFHPSSNKIEEHNKGSFLNLSMIIYSFTFVC
jgi:hypothetical protein